MARNAARFSAASHGGSQGRQVGIGDSVVRHRGESSLCANPPRIGPPWARAGHPGCRDPVPHVVLFSAEEHAVEQFQGTPSMVCEYNTGAG